MFLAISFFLSFFDCVLCDFYLVIIFPDGNRGMAYRDLHPLALPVGYALVVIECCTVWFAVGVVVYNRRCYCVDAVILDTSIFKSTFF